jgi:hypothetical protein
LQRVAHRKKQIVLRHILGARGLASHPLSPARTAAQTQTLRHANLVGVGFGPKETAGAFIGDLAVRIYVKRKLPLYKISAGDRIPGTIDGIVTDIIQIGTPRFHSRPVAFGASISHVQGVAGSLGCVVTKQGDNAWYVLSACHVLAPVGVAHFGDPIVEPPVQNGAAAPLATLSDFETLKDDGSANRFDAAIAKLDRKTDVSTRIPLIGPPKIPAMDPVLYQSVRKFGAGTLHTLGIVTDTAASVAFTMSGDSYLFRDVIQVTGCGGVFTEGGDSGALVVDALSSRPIGLVIGGAGVRTFVSPIDIVLEHFGVQFVQ